MYHSLFAIYPDGSNRPEEPQFPGMALPATTTGDHPYAFADPVVAEELSQALSDQEIALIKAWILESEDPAPGYDDIARRVMQSFSKELAVWITYEIKEWIETRLLNGPPKKEGRLMVPGYGLPLTHKLNQDELRHGFLYGLGSRDFTAKTLTIRESCMLAFINDITDKEEWWLKVRNPEIVQKWKQEALRSPWNQYRENGDFTEDMADYCLDELTRKAEIYEQTGVIPVMDYTTCAVKSDSLLTPELKEALRREIAPLENLPEEMKDWHPGSDKKVLDLVHPSLWPLVYGLTRIVPDKRITLDNCLDYCGVGDIIPDLGRPLVHTFTAWSREIADSRAISNQFQWLPCDVDLTGQRPRIDSYINNLHPVRHANLYLIIEHLIEKSLPAWDLVCRGTINDWSHAPDRFEELMNVEYDCLVPELCGPAGCDPSNRPGSKNNEDEEDDDEEDFEDDEVFEENQRLDEEWFQQNHRLCLPQIKKDQDPTKVLKPEHILRSGFFGNVPRIQVIVKLANIHLTPDKPKYDGGSWHVEGQLNEHICATALYYYDSENITDSNLSFRTKANRDNLMDNLGHAQGDYDSIERIYYIKAWRTTMQNIGSVSTREGRALFFPNVYQHQVSPFELADKTKPGHRKILALFLVDPLVPVLSTANVPPQQLDWWSERVGHLDLLHKLPGEIQAMVRKHVDFPVGEERAKEIREELMKERSAVQETTDQLMDRIEWSFCEH